LYLRDIQNISESKCRCIFLINLCCCDSPNVCDDGWFIIPTLWGTLSTVWRIFDIHWNLGVGPTPNFRQLVVIILMDVIFLN
jgi:hypothetical protein